MRHASTRHAVSCWGLQAAMNGVDIMVQGGVGAGPHGAALQLIHEFRSSLMTLDAISMWPAWLVRYLVSRGTSGVPVFD